MSFLVDERIRLIIQNITGREGSFHARQMLEYGTNVVAGTTPGKGDTSVEGVPVYNTVREASERHEANATVLFVPARFTRDAIFEALDAGIPLIVTVAEGVPVHDMMRVHCHPRAAKSTIIGPNSFGIISPGKAKVGFMAHRIFTPGPVGIMSRSATNCYETVFMLTSRGIGQSTCIGIGGDMMPGSTFGDMLNRFECDEQTRVIVMIGEIGGSDEETAAELIKERVRKPVIALIAGKNAPKDTSMGHAGAIVSPDGEGGAQKKEDSLRKAGVHIAESTEHVVTIVEELLKRTG
jgi:succinyl-CoA synthetase alpha subunit